MNIGRPTLHDLRTLCANARPDEIVQWRALTGLPWEPEAVALDLLDRPGPSFVLLDDHGVPVLAGGFDFVIPGVWRGWMVGTMAGWEQHWRRITLETNRIIRFMLKTERRIELLCIASREAACTWYERGLKMQREGVHPNYGVNGETAVLYARVNKGESDGQL